MPWLVGMLSLPVRKRRSVVVVRFVISYVHPGAGNVLDLLFIFLKGARSAPFKKINNKFETPPWGAFV
jgi:hypothetical protein